MAPLADLHKRVIFLASMPDAWSGGEVGVTGTARLSIRVISLVLAVSTDHSLFSDSHNPARVAPSSSPWVTVSNVGPAEYDGLRQRSIPPSLSAVSTGCELMAYSAPSTDARR